MRKIFLGSLLTLSVSAFALPVSDPGTTTSPQWDIKPVSVADVAEEVIIRVHESTGAAEMLQDDGTWVLMEAISLNDPRVVNMEDVTNKVADVGTHYGTADEPGDGLIHKTQYYGQGYPGVSPYAYPYGYRRPIPVPVPQQIAPVPCMQQFADPCAPCGGCQTAQPYYQVPQQPFVYAAPPPLILRQPRVLVQPRVYAQPRFVRPYAVHRAAPFGVYRYPRRW